MGYLQLAQKAGLTILAIEYLSDKSLVAPATAQFLRLGFLRQPTAGPSALTASPRNGKPRMSRGPAIHGFTDPSPISPTASTNAKKQQRRADATPASLTSDFCS